MVSPRPFSISSVHSVMSFAADGNVKNVPAKSANENIVLGFNILTFSLSFKKLFFPFCRSKTIVLIKRVRNFEKGN